MKDDGVSCLSPNEALHGSQPHHCFQGASSHRRRRQVIWGVSPSLPNSVFLLGLAVGAVCAGFAISATCEMSVKRATIAPGIYLAIQTAFSLAFYFMTR